MTGGAAGGGVRRGSARACAAFAFLALAAAAQTPAKRDAGGVPAPTPALERGRAIYVISSCHFCHGIDLTGAAMGAANLMTSPLVGRDENGNFIGPVVRAGLPNLQTAMPQYSDYSNEQIADLAGYVHYLRRVGRYKELVKIAEPGDLQAGAAYFKNACEACHTAANALTGIAKKYNAAALRARVLRPAPEAALWNGGANAGQTAHMKLLERYSDADVRNLSVYLSGLQ